MRLFVAVRPPAAVVRALASLPRPEAPGVRWTDDQSWHVTLRFLGEMDDPAPVVEALRDLDLGPPVEATVGPATERLSRNVLVVPVEGLDDLAARVRDATAELGKPPDARGFHGHVTLARRGRRAGRVPTGAPIDVGFVADEVVLYSSTLGPSGATHEAIERFPLQR